MDTTDNNQGQIRYSDQKLAEFKEIIINKLTKAQADYDSIMSSIKNDRNNGTDDTAASFKYDDSANTYSQEANAHLANRAEKFIRDLKAALIRIENKTYGICRITGNLINEQRLRIVPHATLSIDAKKNRSEKKK